MVLCGCKGSHAEKVEILGETRMTTQKRKTTNKKGSISHEEES